MTAKAHDTVLSSVSSGSNNSSNYFGSVDSSQNSQKVKGHLSSNDGGPVEMEQGDHFIKYVLQDPVCLLASNTDEKVMMTYQLPSRLVCQWALENSVALCQISVCHGSREG